jgi:hypothetical protein
MTNARGWYTGAAVATSVGVLALVAVAAAAPETTNPIRRVEAQPLPSATSQATRYSSIRADERCTRPTRRRRPARSFARAATVSRSGPR